MLVFYKFADKILNVDFLSLQYVEKLEKILRFVIKEKALSLDDLDNIWAAQVGVYLIF